MRTDAARPAVPVERPAADEPDCAEEPTRLKRVTSLIVLVAPMIVLALVAGVLGRAVAIDATARTHAVAEQPSAARAAPSVASRPQPFPGRVAAGTRQVISVVAAGAGSHYATLRLWSRGSDGAWHLVGKQVPVAVGSGGLTTSPSNSRPQTPLGTWAMNVVLARDAHVTRMPEHVLAAGDGWSSCTACAGYDRLSGSGEMWAGRNSWTRVAIHILTNPQRIPGHSSGMFLHVGGTNPTAGCVGVPLATTLAIARWLDPKAAPRIVIALRR